MAIWSGLGAGARAVLVAGAAGVVAAAGWFSLSGQPKVPSAQTDIADAATAAKPAVPAKPVVVKPALPKAVEATAVEPTVVKPVAVEPVPVEPTVAEPDTALLETTPPKAATMIAPKFDVVRIEPDGSATIAGIAAPDAVVSVILDGTEMITTTADASGNFAALFTLPPSGAPRLLSLSATASDGVVVAGPDTVAVAPTIAAVKEEPSVAELAPAEQTVAEQTVAEVAVELAAPAALLVTESGVQVLQSGGDPAIPSAANVSVDTISYDAAGDVMLGGRGAGAGFVRLYLDSAEIATVSVGADGQWATTLADVTPGIYTLRADQIGADGKVSSRFETPFKRETLQALAAVAAPIPTAAAPEVVQEVEPAAVEPVEVQAAVKAAPTEVAPEAPAVVVVEPAAPAIVVPEPAQPEPAPTVAVAPAIEPATDQQPLAPVSITVQPGFTLWSIAKAQMGNGVMYVQVFEANKDKIRDPDLIYPGQIFTMPGAN